MQKKYKKEDFEGLLNTKFRVTFDSQNAYDVELIEISESKPIKALDLTPFTLTFRGAPDEKIFQQRLYDVSSETLGDMALFLIPRFPDKEGVYYDVIFS